MSDRDRNKHPGAGGQDLDGTINELDTLLKNRPASGYPQPGGTRPPPEANIPRLTDVVQSVQPATHDRIPDLALRPKGDGPDETGAAGGAETSQMEAVHESINMGLKKALSELKSDFIGEIKREVLESIEALAAKKTRAARAEDKPATAKDDATGMAKEQNQQMEKTYNPAGVEAERYRFWEQAGYFQPRGDGEPYCIMLPPPNVTGNLHMGHAFQDTLMDALIRYKRMQGTRTLWQCGTDHAGIATQMVVERQLAAEGVSRTELGREKFVAAVWQWKGESGGTITQQLRRMGASMDWSRERFTLDPELSRAVTEVFVRLFDEGLIYRGKRLVNWDPVLHTAISDLEVVAEEESGHLWHILYPLTDGTGHVVVATTRPETMLGDTAVAVHPNDDRYRRIIGKRVELPLCGRTIPIIADTHVDPEFGSGCVKITPAHDFNDYEVGKRHGLPQINIFTPSAALNDQVPEPYRNLDRFEARKSVVADLEAQGFLIRVDDHKLTVPRGDRSNAVIEPYLTDQWYVRIGPLAEPAIAAVETGRIRFIPDNWSKTYFEWMRNIEDWCISRQLWWGHRIPAWYDDQGNIYVGRDESEVRSRAGIAPDVPLRQDEDVLDTWFSSALWPFSTLGWPENTPELKTFYPTSVLVTGFDIIFFWVARMIMMGIKFMGDVPFREVYIHGLVRDADGNKMSKSKGNILDPTDLIDGIDLEPLVAKRTRGLMRPQDAPKIEAATRKHYPDGIPGFGTDALRFTFASMATQGRDIRFDLGRIGGYRNFCNKIWNASRYVLLTCDGVRIERTGGPAANGLAERWIRSRMHETVRHVRQGFDTYRFDLAAQAIYEFVWDEYCDWYIEVAKINLRSADDAAKLAIQRVLLEILEATLRTLHPIMPFITDEIWLKVAPLLGKGGRTITLQPFPHTSAFPLDAEATREFEWLQRFVLGVRRIRAENNIEPKRAVPIRARGGTAEEQRWFENDRLVISRLARAESLDLSDAEVAEDAAAALAGEMTILVPLGGLIDRRAETGRLQKELDKLGNELARVEGKLNNESFVAKAPTAIVAKERARRIEVADAIDKLATQLQKLSGQ
jgi:valyl-tRNA synthetase